MIEVTAIFGAPRSGTTWLGQLYNSSPQVAYRFQPLFSHAFKARISESSSAEEINKFYHDILITDDPFVTQQKNVNDNVTIQFDKEKITQLVWKEVRYHYVISHLLATTNTKVVGIIRHPCAGLWSWFNAPKEFKKEWNMMREWRIASLKNLDRKEEYNGYEKWKEIAFDFIRLTQMYPQQFRIIKYEELNRETNAVMRSLFDFSGIEWNKQTEDFVQASKSSNDNDPYGVFKKDKDNNEWNNKLPEAIKQAILNDPDFTRLNKYYKWE